MERTSVKTRRITTGHYASLNGAVSVKRAEDGKSWKLLDSAGHEFGDGFKTSDAALTAAVTEHGYSLEALNTPPAKPKAAKPQPKPEAAEEGGSERRTGSTGPAPAKPHGARPSVKRGARKVA